MSEPAEKNGAKHAEAPPPIGGPALNYLSELAQNAFERQEDLDESIWRSLPFFAAATALAVTLLSKAAADLPVFAWSAVPFISNVLFWVSLGSFAWTIRWFWDLLRPREYQYPPDISEIEKFAEEIAIFHAGRGLKASKLDEEVSRELKALVTKLYGDAARTNLINNAAKLAARGQLLLFMLTGFLLVIAAEGITYVSDVVIHSSSKATNVEKTEPPANVT